MSGSGIRGPGSGVPDSEPGPETAQDEIHFSIGFPETRSRIAILHFSGKSYPANLRIQTLRYRTGCE